MHNLPPSTQQASRPVERLSITGVEHFPPEFAPADHPNRPPAILPDGSLSQHEAARRFGVSRYTIRRWIARQILHAYLHGGKAGVAHLRVVL